MSNLKYHVPLFLKEVITLAFFTKKKVTISYVKNNEGKFLINSYEIEILKIVCKLIPDSKVMINKKNSNLIFVPGFCEMRSGLVFNTFSRGISYFLEFILQFIVIKREGLEIMIRGQRSFPTDSLIEKILYVDMPMIRKFCGNNIKVRIFGENNLENNCISVLLTSTRPAMLMNFNIKQPELGINFRFMTISTNSCLILNDNLFNEIQKWAKGMKQAVKMYNINLKNNKLNFFGFLVIGETESGYLTSREIGSFTRFLNPELFGSVCKEMVEFITINTSKGCLIDYSFISTLLLISLVSFGKGISEFSILRLSLNFIYSLRQIKKCTGAMYKINREKYNGGFKISGPFF